MSAFLVAAVALALFASDGGVLLWRPLWVDEVHTMLVADRASPVDVIADLANGADFGPPLVPLAAWALRHVVPQLTPTMLRLASLACVLGALLLVYSVLRKRFGVEASLAGVLAVGTQELVIAHSFEGRFYGPWLLCIAFVAWTLSAPRPRWTLAVASVLLCTVHWYGVIALSLMLAAVVALHWRGWRSAIMEVLPASAGFVALAACIPLSLGQRQALSVSTWVPDFTFAQLTVLLTALWGSAVPVVGMLAFAVGAIARRAMRGHSLAEPLRSAGQQPGVVAVLSLALMPLVLAALSAAGQPSMLGRYNIPAVLAWAPLIALGAEAIGRWPSRLLAAWLLWLWLPGYAREARRKRAFDVGVRQAATSYRKATESNVPVVFMSMHTLYAVSALHPKERSSLAFLELTDSTLFALFGGDARFQRLNKGVHVEMDVVRVHARRFGFPQVAKQSYLQLAPRFALVAPAPDLPSGYSTVEAYGRALFPGHCVHTVAEGVTLFVRSAGTAKC